MKKKKSIKTMDKKIDGIGNNGNRQEDACTYRTMRSEQQKNESSQPGATRFERSAIAILQNVVRVVSIVEATLPVLTVTWCVYNVFPVYTVCFPTVRRD